jgi:hypothetical protein
MKNNEVEAFYISALQYCSLIENWNKKNNELKNLIASLLDLYSTALYLPEIEPTDAEVSDFNISIPKIDFGQYNHYWEVFNPYDLDEPLEGSLSDDIMDIYQDIKRGLLLFEKNKYIEAIWQWKFNFEIHWGNHAVDAIRALHSAKSI